MSKYHSSKIILDGIKFDSKKEGKRYTQLKEMLNEGKISNLELQKRFELQPSFRINGKAIRNISYIADFVYIDNLTNEKIVEDVKGLKTDLYRLKKKLFEYKYKIEIKEI